MGEKSAHEQKKLSELMTECGTISISWRETSIVVGEKYFFLQPAAQKAIDNVFKEVVGLAVDAVNFKFHLQWSR